MTPTSTAARSRARRALPPAYALVVPALAGLGGLAFLAAKPGVARSMAASPRALGFTVLVAALMGGATWLLPRLGARPAVTVLAQLVPAALAFGLAVLPAFRQVTVVEAFPEAFPEASPEASPEAGPPTATAAAERPRAGRADVVARAPLHGIDHDATGQALLVMGGDGRYAVRLQSLDVEPGPDYQVHLVPGRDRTRPSGGTHLDRLRGNRGSQNYDVPAEVAVDGPVTVLIWCRAFAVPVASATLG